MLFHIKKRCFGHFRTLFLRSSKDFSESLKADYRMLKQGDSM